MLLRILVHEQRREYYAHWPSWSRKHWPFFEAEVLELHSMMAQPDYYKQLSSEITREKAHLTGLEQQLAAAAYRPWEELERQAE
jgi:hypothetical protein